MTPHDFIAKWRHSELKERSGSQSHFNDLCALLGVLDPASADATGDSFTFEKGASKTGGGEGWADVWKRGCFAWEYIILLPARCPCVRARYDLSLPQFVQETCKNAIKTFERWMFREMVGQFANDRSRRFGIGLRFRCPRATGVQRIPW